MKRILSLLLAGLLLAGADKPLVIESGQTRQLPAATALQLSAPTTANATVNMPHGTAPTSPTNGDCWTTTSGLFCRINGATVGPYGGTPAGAALTKADDTNVTLTLGGSPSTALLAGTSITAGWTGQLAVTRGGTGLASIAQGDLLYGSASNTLTALAKSTSASRYLSNGGTSNNPSWAQVDLTNGVTGRLPFANLAQLAGLSVHGVTGSSTADMAAITGTADQVLRVNGAGTALAFGSIDLSKSATVGTSRLALANIAQGTALSVRGVAGNATADTADIAAGSDNQVLRRSGTAIGFGAVNLASSSAVTGTLPVANGGTGSTSAALGTGGVLLGTEGTFTPTLVFGSGSTGMTFSRQDGRWKKVGNLIHVWMDLILTAKGSSTGNVQISNLPATSLSAHHVAAALTPDHMSAGTTNPRPLLVAGTTQLFLYDFSAGNLSVMTDANFTNTTEIIIYLAYPLS